MTTAPSVAEQQPDRRFLSVRYRTPIVYSLRKNPHLYLTYLCYDTATPKSRTTSNTPGCLDVATCVVVYEAWWNRNA